MNDQPVFQGIAAGVKRLVTKKNQQCSSEAPSEPQHYLEAARHLKITQSTIHELIDPHSQRSAEVLT